MIFDLHTHTRRSFDAFTTERELLLACRARGVNVVGITEHDLWPRINADEFLRNGVVPLYGCEFTTLEGVHIIGFFDSIIKGDAEIPLKKQNIISYVKKSNGILVMPHPLKKNTGYLEVYGEDYDVSSFDFIELVNGGDLRNANSAYVRQVAQRYRIKPLSSSDSHSVEQVGMCVTRIRASGRISDSTEAFLILKHCAGDDVELLIDQSLKLRSVKTRTYKQSKGYQLLLSLIPKNIRRSIKLGINILNFGKLKISKPAWVPSEEF